KIFQNKELVGRCHVSRFTLHVARWTKIGFEFQVASCVFRVASFELLVSRFEFRISSFELNQSLLSFRGVSSPRNLLCIFALDLQNHDGWSRAFSPASSHLSDPRL